MPWNAFGDRTEMTPHKCPRAIQKERTARASRMRAPSRHRDAHSDPDLRIVASFLIPDELQGPCGRARPDFLEAASP
jgi:hypothetical protein